MSYDGSLPVAISANLGEERFYDAVAGVVGDLYYISMRTEQNTWWMFTFDTGKGIWHKEDNLHVMCMATLRDAIYAIAEVAGQEGYHLIALNGADGSMELADKLPWEITFGAYGFDAERQKYLSKYTIRILLTGRTSVTCSIQYDSSGTWEDAGTFTSDEGQVRSLNIPIIPRRCDHCQLRLTGTGEMKLYSIARAYRGGSRNNGSYLH
jgi:hypothetical protein